MRRFRLYLILTVLFLGLINVAAQQKSAKRGICGDATPEDLAAFAPYLSWYYDWGVEPPAESEGQLSGIEWVPMTWGGVTAGQVNDIVARIPEGSVYLLGFNEPNFTSQANLTPAQAAALWPNVEQIATEKGLILVSPAVNWCGGCVEGVTSDPVDWLDKFIAECPTCEFDYIAIHNYNSHLSALQWYVEKFKKYGKKIWLTEFAAWDEGTEYAGVVEYMKQAIPYLENDTNIFRYSWFATRVDANPDIDLLGANGELSKLGKLYATMPFEGSSTEDLAPIAFLQNETSINLPKTSLTMSGNTYDPNGDEITIEWSQIDGPGEATINDISIAQPVISGLALGDYIFQMKVTANEKSDSARITVHVNVANIAKGKTATSSSNQDGNPASAAIDGDINSRWSSLDSDPQWIKVDLKNIYNLTGAKIVWEAAFAKIFRIEVSNDETEWTPVYNTSTGDGGTDIFTFDATARYIRMYSQQRNNQSQWWGNSIWEFEVYGELAPASNVLTAEYTNLKIYPNPAKNILNIEMTEEHDNLSFVLVQIDGKQVGYAELESGLSYVSMDIQELNSGVYILKMMGQNQNKNFVITRE